MTPISQGLRGVYLDVSWIFLELVLCHLATICSDALFFRNIKFPPDNLASVKECKWFATRFVLPYLSTQTTMSAVVLSTEQAPYYKCTASLHKSLLSGWIHSITRFSSAYEPDRLLFFRNWHFLKRFLHVKDECKLNSLIRVNEWCSSLQAKSQCN